MRVKNMLVKQRVKFWTVFCKLFDAQIKLMLLYASEIWGTSRLSITESSHLFACKRLLGLSDKSPNHKRVYGETARYPLYTDSTISSLRYWLKLRRMPIIRILKQVLIMLQNSLDLGGKGKRKNWAGNIKECFESQGFQDVWTQGRVNNEVAFLYSIGQKMVERFKLEWSTKISDSDRFSTYRIFRSVLQAEKYINDITIKKFRDIIIRLRLGIYELGVNKRFQPESVNKTCPLRSNVLEDVFHLLFNCPVYADIRYKYLRQFIVHDVELSFNSLFKKCKY